jgi:hypothetical protein
VLKEMELAVIGVGLLPHATSPERMAERLMRTKIFLSDVRDG